MSLKLTGPKQALRELSNTFGNVLILRVTPASLSFFDKSLSVEHIFATEDTHPQSIRNWLALLSKEETEEATYLVIRRQENFSAVPVDVKGLTNVVLVDDLVQVNNRYKSVICTDKECCPIDGTSFQEVTV